MRFRVHLKSVGYSHLIAGWTAAIVAAAILSQFQFREFVGYAFPIFLGPLLLPIAMMFESQRQMVIAGGFYGVAFCMSLILQERLLARRRRDALAGVASTGVQPVEDGILQYFAQLPAEPEHFGKIELIAAGCMIFTLFAAIVCVGITTWRENSGREPLGHWVLWPLLVSASIAAATGVAGCFATKPRTGPRRVAFLACLFGLVMVLVFSFLLYYVSSGLYRYDG